MANRAIWQDVSVSAAIAGFVTVLVGFTSSAAIVFQSAQVLGATPAEIGSWMGALGLGMGITSMGLSLRYHAPVATAWSTPGAAMLITTAAGVPMTEAIGAFLLSAALITVAGFSGWFERMIDRIPIPIASAMLAGVLFRFGLDLFIAMKTQFAMTFAMFCTYLIFRRVLPRYAVVTALVLGMAIAAVQGLLQLDGIRLELAQLIFTSP
jgi:benzoate membrane transport protein